MLVDPDRGLVDEACHGCGSTTFYIGALSRLCVTCLDRSARMARATKREGPMTPRTTTTKESHDQAEVHD